MAPPQAKKRTQGRRKIEMKVIEDENARVVTFSKRRASLFKKATELSVLCGAQVALIIFSVGGRAHSFGHPNVESVTDRFFNRNPMQNLQDSDSGTQDQGAMLRQLKDQCDQMSADLQTRKGRTREIQEALESSPIQVSDEHINMLDIHQLKNLKVMLENLREKVGLLAKSPQMVSVVAPPYSMDISGPSNSDAPNATPAETPVWLNSEDGSEKREEGPNKPPQFSIVPPPQSLDIAGPSNSEKAVRVSVERDGPNKPPQFSIVPPPQSLDIAGPPNSEKAVRVTVETDGWDDTQTLVWLKPKDGSEKRDEPGPSPISPILSKSHKIDLSNIESDTGDASPIPPDWLAL